MKNIQISLANAFIWFLNGGKYHLSESSPGPIEIDFSTLSRDDQKAIIYAVKLSQVNCSVPIDQLVQIYNGITIPSQPLPEPQRVDNELIVLMGRSISTIKRTIVSTNDVRKLRLMLELETAHRNRNAIVKSIRDKIDLLNNQVKNSIIDTVPDPRKITPEELLTEQFEVIESDNEEISIIIPER